MLLDAADYGLSPGGIGPLASRLVPISGASKAGQNYSELGPLVPDLPATFAGRTASTLVALTVSDTASISATEGPIDTQEIESADTARLSVSESTQLFNFLSAADTANLSLSETISLVITGVTAKTGSDTASLSLTESVAIAVTVDVTDTASLTLTESSSVAVSTEQVTVSDTASLTLDEAVSLNVFSGVNAISAVDGAALALVETANVLEVRRIKRIALSISRPYIELEFL
jgi:hypothetical protein